MCAESYDANENGERGRACADQGECFRLSIHLTYLEIALSLATACLMNTGFRLRVIL
jgi:hypothetical protein